LDPYFAHGVPESTNFVVEADLMAIKGGHQGHTGLGKDPFCLRPDLDRGEGYRIISTNSLHWSLQIDANMASSIGEGIMSKIVTLELADKTYELLVKTSVQRGQTPEQVIIEWLQERIQQTAQDPLQLAGVIDLESTDEVDVERHDIDAEFARQVADFIQEYRPALEALAK
jgi:hypothetical protein